MVYSARSSGAKTARRRPALETGKVQQRVHQLQQPQRIVIRQFDARLLLWTKRLECRAKSVFERAQHQGQRRSEFARCQHRHYWRKQSSRRPVHPASAFASHGDRCLPPQVPGCDEPLPAPPSLVFPRSSSPSSLARTRSVTSSTRCRINRTSPDWERTGRFFGLQYFDSKLPSGPRISYFCTAMVSAARVARTRFREARRLAVPVADGSSGLSGNKSNRLRFIVCSRVVWVAIKRAFVAATIVKRGESGSSTRRTSGEVSNRRRKSSSPSTIWELMLPTERSGPPVLNHCGPGKVALAAGRCRYVCAPAIQVAHFPGYPVATERYRYHRTQQGATMAKIRRLSSTFAAQPL